MFLLYSSIPKGLDTIHNTHHSIKVLDGVYSDDVSVVMLMFWAQIKNVRSKFETNCKTYIYVNVHSFTNKDPICLRAQVIDNWWSIFIVHSWLFFVEKIIRIKPSCFSFKLFTTNSSSVSVTRQLRAKSWSYQGYWHQLQIINALQG